MTSISPRGKTLSKIKSYAAAVLFGAVLLFLAHGRGYSAAERDLQVKFLQEQAVQDAIWVDRVNAESAKVARLIVRQTQLLESSKEARLKIEELINDEKNVVCAPSPDVVGMFNNLISEKFSATIPATRVSETDTALESLGFVCEGSANDVDYRELLASYSETINQYNAARLQCNSLIEWVSATYESETKNK